MWIQNLELSEQKQNVARVYDLAAAGYDKPALRFFSLTSERLVQFAGIRAGDHVLDAGTGTGLAAFAAAERVGAAGKVIGVDIGEEILQQASRKLEADSHNSISFSLGDMEHLEFSDQSFDAVLSAASLFFLKDMAAGLQEWKRVLKAGGRIAVSGYGDSAFRPLSDLFEARIRSYGVQLAAPIRPFSWQRLTDPEQYFSLFRIVGLENIEVYSEQLGYYLTSASEWWDVVWNSGFRGPISQLTPEQVSQFKQEHLAEVQNLATSKGIWLDIAAIFAVGQKG
ncbi:MAG TPA: class I SAM-dependent methyltransferase [Anaerolineales bacterium]|nr:class I SAM-dependent methyltransferase [Anaerolineales bacterium]